MSYTIENDYVGDGSTVLYSFTFEYIEPTDVEVSLDSVLTTEWTFANATTVEFNTAPGSDVAIRIYRNTTVDSPKATFFPGSAIRAQDLNDNFEQILYVTQESDVISQRAEDAGKEAEIAADLATTAAANAEAAGDAAQASASAAQSSASAAASSAAQAASDSSNASAKADQADIKATQAASDASVALSASNQAASDASTAQAAAVSAASDASSAQSDAATAASVASDAEDAADGAVVIANAATSTAQAAQVVANAADGKADTALSEADTAIATANAAAAAVSDALLFQVVATVSAIPASPSDGDAVEVSDSTGIESFTPLAGLPAGFIGDDGKKVAIRFASSTWNYLSYSPNDPDARYAGPATGVGSASSPSIGFAGDQNTGIFHPSDGAVAITSNGTSVSQIDSNGIKIGGAVPSSPNISLGSDGAADFAGSINTAGNIVADNRIIGTDSVRTGNISTGSTTNSGVNAYNEGKIDIQRTGSGILFRGLEGTNENVIINSDGSATFAGSIVSGDNNIRLDQSVDVFVAGNSSGTTLFNALSGSNYANRTSVAQITADGSATFAGTVSTGDASPWTNPSALSGSQLDSGQLLMYRTETDGSAVFLAGYNGNGGSPVFQAKTDGSADFAGTIESTTFDNSSDAGKGYTLFKDGAISVQRAAFQTNASLFNAYLGNTAVFTVTADARLKLGGVVDSAPSIDLKGSDGSATFGGGNITLNANGSSEFAKGTKFRNEGTSNGFVNISSSSTAGLVLNDGSAQTAQINWDGSATFAKTLEVKTDENNKASIYRTGGMEGTKNGIAAWTIRDNGSADFAGRVISNDGSGSTVLNQDAASGLNIYSGANLNIYLKKDGSATYAGKLTSATTISSDSGSTLVTKSYVDSGGASAWGNFSGSNGSLRDGNNVSVSKDSSGVYSVTFSSALANANYSIVISTSNDPGVGALLGANYTDQTSSGFKIKCYVTGSVTFANPTSISFTVFGG